jgi:hypothetical protein
MDINYSRSWDRVSSRPSPRFTQSSGRAS